jgi:WD40 repeat protein
VWDAATGERLHELEGPGDVEWMQWHPRGNVLLAGSSDSTVWMWSVARAAAQALQVFAGHDGSVTCGTFSSSGKTVLTGSEDSTVRVWNPKTGAAGAVFKGHGWCEGPVTSLVVQADVSG